MTGEALDWLRANELPDSMPISAMLRDLIIAEGHPAPDKDLVAMAARQIAALMGAVVALEERVARLEHLLPKG